MERNQGEFSTMEQELEEIYSEALIFNNVSISPC